MKMKKLSDSALRNEQEREIEITKRLVEAEKKWQRVVWVDEV